MFQRTCAGFCRNVAHFSRLCLAHASMSMCVSHLSSSILSLPPKTALFSSYHKGLVSASDLAQEADRMVQGLVGGEEFAEGKQTRSWFFGHG